MSTAQVPYTITPTGISVLVGAKMRIIAKSSANHDALRDHLRTGKHDIGMISELADIESFIAKMTMGEVQIGTDAVRWRGKKVHNVVVDRILDAVKAGHNLDHLVAFLDRVMLNPVDTAAQELFTWL